MEKEKKLNIKKFIDNNALNDVITKIINIIKDLKEKKEVNSIINELNDIIIIISKIIEDNKKKKSRNRGTY